MDEKSFLISICIILKQIVAKRQLESSKLFGASRDGSREFLFLVACICADGTALPPVLTYEGKSHDLQDTWLEDFDHSADEAYFSASPKGWTNDALGISWLKTVFLRHTGPKEGNNKRLLILDGHSSHVNWEFIKICDKNNIILGILPPHSTHRLQPLDLKIFLPLSTAYSRQIDQIFNKSMGYTRLTKCNFWRVFKHAWQKALIPANIFSAFKVAGIHPFKPAIVFDKIKFKTPSPSPVDKEGTAKIPGSIRGIRRHIKALREAGILQEEGVDLLARACQKLAISNEILGHVNSGLQEALITEQKRRKRSKKMGLVEKDEPGHCVFFSPAKIAEARVRQNALAAEQEEEKTRKEQKKLEKAFERERKAQEARERA